MNIIKMILPYGMVRLFQKCIRNKRKCRKYPDFLKKNIIIKDRYKGNRCFVVGNGSSLNEMDLKLLKNEYTYVVNDFIRHKDLNYIAPTFYSEIEPFNYLITLPSDNPYNIDAYYHRIDEALKPLNTILFFRSEFKKFIEDNNLFLGKEIFYLQSDSCNVFNTTELEDDISKPNSFMAGVIYSAICNCAYMGFKDIYFIGCDCDWFRQKTEAHFYENPECIPKNKRNEDLLLENYNTLKRWRIVTTHFKKKGLNIYNAGIGGDNDTCDRVDYLRILLKKKGK
jgi:hypothetical protein